MLSICHEEYKMYHETLSHAKHNCNMEVTGVSKWLAWSPKLNAHKCEGFKFNQGL